VNESGDRKGSSTKGGSVITAAHVDIIKAAFWKDHPTILGPDSNIEGD